MWKMIIPHTLIRTGLLTFLTFYSEIEDLKILHLCTAQCLMFDSIWIIFLQEVFKNITAVTTADNPSVDGFSHFSRQNLKHLLVAASST